MEVHVLKISKLLKLFLAVMLVLPVTSYVTAFTNTAYAEGPTDPAPFINPVGTPNGKKVLFDNTHGETAGAADWVIDGAFSDFGNGLAQRGYYVKELRKTTPITLDDLKDYDVFVLPEANIPFKTSEQAALLEYVQQGGSIFFIADHYNADRNLNRWDSAEVFNGYRRGAFGEPTKGMSADEANSEAMQGVTSTDWLAENFGVRFRYNALGDITSGVTIVPPTESFGITEGVGSVEMHAGGTVAILDPTKAKGLVYLPENPPAWGPAVDQGVYENGGIAEGAFSAIAKVGLGKAAFIGDSSPVEDSTPKYLREDTGNPKKTYDGFSTEGDNGLYLLNVVDWLAEDEAYTSFEGKIPLSEETTLLAFEDPASSTEPEAEPWTTPPTGYKWYDRSTFAAGSYGSDKEASNPQYSFVHQDVLPNNGEEFTVRVQVSDLLPGETLSDIKVGLYLTDGGRQIGYFDGATYAGYTPEFSVTADATGHAYKDLNVKIEPGTTGAARLRIKQDGDNVLTKDVTLGDVDPETLPENEIEVPDLTTITDARQQADGELVTVEGVVTSNPGAWGGKGFYLQDDTAGIYVYQSSNSEGYKIGDHIKISAQKTTYNGEAELTDILKSEIIGTSELPEALIQDTVDATNQGQVVKLQRVRVQNISEPDRFGTFEFDAVHGNTVTRVRVDNRTGMDYDDFVALYRENSVLNITGVASIFKDTYQLKPRFSEDIIKVQLDNIGKHLGLLK